jgi:capsular exopolysaccharide synthesis family protein
MGKVSMAIERSVADKNSQMLRPIATPASREVDFFSSQMYLKNSSPEWYREIKTKLQTMHSPGAIKSISFTSTSCASGNSSIACGFAACLAVDFGHRVLLIDACPRRPGIHHRFYSDHTFGLSQMLNGDEGDDQVAGNPISHSIHSNLMVVTCSEDETGAVGLFLSKQFSDFLKSAREKFDYIILDTPPIIQFSESRVISSLTDGTILIVESGRTRKQVALKAKKDIEAAGGKVLGVVLNRQKYIIPKWLYRWL